MFARVTRSRVPLDKLDSGIERFRTLTVPSFKTQPGFVGAALSVDRASGEGTSVSYWETGEALAASEAMAIEGRTDMTRAVGTEVIEIDRFEVLLRDSDGPARTPAFTRVNDLVADVAQIDATVAFLKEKGIPALRAHSGYAACLIFANRTTGRMQVISVWNSAAEREASGADIGPLRQLAADVARASNVRVTNYEGVFIDLSTAAHARIRAATA